MRMGFSTVVKGNHSHMVSLDTPLHVDAVTDSSKLPCNKYLERQQSTNSHRYNPPPRLIVSSFGQHESCNRTYGRTMLIGKKKKRLISPVTGLGWPSGFQEVKVPRLHDNGTEWW